MIPLIRPVLDALHRRRSAVPCNEHTFRAGWDFCTVCGLYKRDIPRAKGGTA